MILVNGASSQFIDARDRGLAYGDGVFRTFPMQSGRPVAWSRQYKKLDTDCAAMQIACPGEAVLKQDLAAVASHEPDCVIKIIVTRGIAERGYAIPVAAIPTRIVLSTPAPDYPASYFEAGIRVHLCRLRLSSQPASTGIKHLNRLENVLARMEWNDPDIAEGLLCDADDYLIGGTMSNVFVAKDGKLTTPALDRCGIAGVTRERIMELSRDRGIAVRIGKITIDELLAADEIFLTNSVIGIWQIAAIDRRTWARGSLTTKIRSWLQNAQDH
jgi:4-amino-4-deoxychorismate lyase